jgi:hypothetical protein
MTEAIDKLRPVEPVSSRDKMLPDSGARHVAADKDEIHQRPPLHPYKGKFLDVVA